MHHPHHLSQSDVDAALCKRNSIAPDELLQTLGAYVGCSYSSNINRFSKLYRVMLQAPADGRIDTESLHGIFVRTENGDMSPVSNYISLTQVYGAENLSHFNLFQSILPMIFATGVGSNGSRSLAIGVIGGMILGTAALLYITPAIYTLLNRKPV